MALRKRKAREAELPPETIREMNEAKKQDTNAATKDRIYAWLIDRYTKHNHLFMASDVIVWKGAVYELPTMLGYIVFFGLFLWLASISFKRYGDARTIVFFLLLMMWRLQIIIGYLNKINKKL